DIPELTSRILQNLHDDHLSLYSCTLVNRFWCRLTVPILWGDPFSFKFNKNKQFHFLDIYLSFLTEKDKNTLKEFGLCHERIDVLSSIKPLFNYPSFIKVLDTSKVETIIKLWASLYLKYEHHTSYMPVFTNRGEKLFYPTITNYPQNQASLPAYVSPATTISNVRLARRNALPNLMLNSRNQITQQNMLSYANRRRNALLPESIGYLPDAEVMILNKSTIFIYIALLKLFVVKNASLNTFEVILQQAFGRESLANICELFLNNSKLFFKTEDLKINFNYILSDIIQMPNLSKIRQFFTYLPYFCTSIKYLTLQLITVDDKYLAADIAHLIKSQTQLSKISFKQINMDIFSSLIFLKSCSPSLTSITFDGCNFKDVSSLEGLGCLINLESLHFINCISLNEMVVHSFIVNLTTPIKIKSFTFLYTYRYYRILELNNPISHLFVQKFGKTIRNLVLSLNGFRSNDIPEAILDYCERIDFLHLANISHKNISSVLKVVKFLSKSIRYLTLEVIRCNWIYAGCDEIKKDSLDINSELLRSLGDILPKQLIYLNIYLIIIDPNDLREFLEMCKEVHFTKLLIRTKNQKDTEEILDILTEFVAETKCLEYLTYESDVIGIFPDMLYYNNYLEKKFKEIGSSVKVKSYNELVAKLDYN
ncbi:10727_t:CDS:1, partial [Funneliformis mosseae]